MSDGAGAEWPEGCRRDQLGEKSAALGSVLTGIFIGTADVSEPNGD